MFYIYIGLLYFIIIIYIICLLNNKDIFFLDYSSIIFDRIDLQ